MIGATEIKRGDLLNLDGAPWEVTEATMQTPSACSGGGLSPPTAMS